MEQIIEQLEKLNKKADAIIGIMQTPVSKLKKISEIIATAVAIISVLAIIDVIRSWIIGG